MMSNEHTWRERAPRNRTLTVSAEETAALKPMVSAIDELRAGFCDDMLIKGEGCS